mmetsp:Transcript_98203/g.262338  ORF Transcript_98203/g.262338 Transcript_98203/m.262338 type:complete len:451 (-) Transcript_98203:8-1360(-)
MSRVYLVDFADEVVSTLGFGWYQVRLLSLCGVGYFAACAEILVTAFIASDVQHEFGISAVAFSLLPVFSNAASFGSSLAFGRWADRGGRRGPFTVGLLLCAVAGAASSAAPYWWCLIILRCLVGCGLGCLSVVDFLMLVEFTPAAGRGKMSMIVFLAGCFGVIYVASVNLVGLRGLLPIAPWRSLMMASALPSIGAVGFRGFFADESPRFLMSQGKDEEAFQVLARMATANGVRERLPSKEEFLDRCRQTSVAPGVAHSLFSVMKAVDSTLALAVVWVLQSVSYWGVTTFLPAFLARAGIPARQTIFAMVCAELPGGVLAAILMDFVGRFWTLRLFFFGASLMSAAVVILVALDKADALLCWACAGTYMFLVPVWSILFVCTPELYPAEVRGRALGMFQTLQTLPELVSPVISAQLISAASPWVFMAAWSSLLAVALAVSAVAMRTRRCG